MQSRTARLIRSRRRRRQKQQGSAAHILIFFLFGGLGLVLLALLGVGGTIGGFVGTYLYYARELPPPARIESLQDQAFETTILYDRTGLQAIYEIVPPLEGDRQRVSLFDLPDYLLQATIAIEDRSFYENPGFNPRGIARAMWSNFTGGQVQGGSSITQQLVKNVLIPEEERTAISADRKIKELILASEISRIYSKDQILEWYLNTNFYGNLAYGVEAGSRVYFNKSARDLTLAEASLLAAIPQFPLMNPIDNPDLARQRQELVLNQMTSQGYISAEEAQAALDEVIVIRPFSERYAITAPHFSLYARNEAQTLLNQLGYDGAYLVSRGGLRIYTTLDIDLQAQMECAARSHINRLSGAGADFSAPTSIGGPCPAANYLPAPTDDLLATPRSVTNAAGTIIRAETGEIIAMMGSADYWDEAIDGNFNVVTALRQPASTFKPLVYLAAFLTPLDGSRIVTPATMLSDVETRFIDRDGQPYTPQNQDLAFHGPMSVRRALANSYNVPAVQALNWIGFSPVLDIAHQMGVNSLNDQSYGLALALGAGEVSLLDMTYTYNVFNTLGYGVGTPVHASQARQGYRQLNPVSILRIESAEGETLWAYSAEGGTFDRRAILPSGMAYIMTDILADHEARRPTFPRGNPLELSRPAAAKTGTTDDNRDSWTIGYTPYYTAGLWVGNNDNRPMAGITGINGAAPIWHAVMEYLHERDNLPPAGWERPSTVVEQAVCLWSGMLPTQNCSQVPREVFYVDPVLGVDYRPQQPDDMWYRLAVDSCNNTRANETTPPQCLQENIFFRFPPELQDWARSNTPELLPPEAEGFIREDNSLFSPVAIVSPRFPAQVSGVVEVFGNTSLEDFAYYQLGYGAGDNPTSFIPLISEGATSGFNELLGAWDTRPLQDGIYILQLQVVQSNNRIQTASSRVTVDNSPPEIRLIAPIDGARFSAQTDIIIDFEVEVFDRGDIAQVAFYIDALQDREIDADIGGVFLGENVTFPYSFPWAIQAAGQRTFWAVAYDRAGNRTASNQVRLILD